MRLVSCQDDDLKVLIGKRFILTFDNGIIVIKHWLIHNTIRMDRYNKTVYTDERNSLTIKENKAYTDMETKCIPNGNHLVTQVKLSKVKLSKVKLDISEKLKNKYSPSLLTDFTLYWEETDKKGIPRWKKEKTWDTEKRLIRWQRNQEKWDYEKNQKYLIKKMSM